MKLYIKSIALAMLAMGTAVALPSCSEDSIYNVNANDVPEAANYAENVVITVDQSTNIATFSFNAKGVYPVWIIDGKSYSTTHEFTRYYRKAGEYQVEVKVANANGISKGTITKSFTVDKTMMNGFGGYKFDSDFNLWTKANVKLNSFWYAPGWSQIADPEYTMTKEAISLTLPQATTDQWQAQMHVGTDICLNEGEAYDFSIIFTATKDMNNITVKIHPDGDDDDAHSFFPNSKVNITAGEPKAFWFSNLTAAVPMNNLVFTFDFGGNPEGVEVTIENIVLKRHADDDGTVLPELPTTPEPNWVDVNSADNLWSTCNYTNSFHYAPGWAQIADPVLTFDGRNFSIDLPSATFEQWQSQVKFHTDLAATDTNLAYDFKITLKSNKEIGGATIKLVQSDEIVDGQEVKHDTNFFFDETVKLEADVPTTFWQASVKAPEAMHAVSLVLDFGGNPEGTVVEVSDIIFQVHHD